MNRALEWTSLALALAAMAVSLLASQGSSWALTFSLLSVALAAVELMQEPRRALLILSYLPAFVLALAVFTFDGHGLGSAALAAAALGLQGRLFALRSAQSARERNRRFADDLQASLPAEVCVFIDVDIESIVARASVNEGHIIRIRPGDVIPCDGQVTYGSSFVDESPLGGDREPRTKGMGSYVFGGSVNRNGSFLYRAIATPEQSHVMRLARALRKGFAYESLFSPSLFLLEASLGALAVIFFLIDSAALSSLLNVFLASAGAGFAAAAWARNQAIVARSAAEGIAWKGKESLERVGATESVVSTAAGVLTEGRFRLMAVEGTEFTGEDAALRLLGPLARRLESEIAFSILQELQVRNIPLELVEAYSPMAGGSIGLVTGEEVRWVDLETARVEGIPMAKLDAFCAEHSRAGESIVLLLRENRAAAALAFADKLQPAASGGLSLLRRQDIPYLLVAPESEATVRRMKEDLNLPHVHTDAGQREAEALLSRLEGESMSPLWVAVPGWKLSPRQGSLVAGAQTGPDSCNQADAATLRSDISTVARLVRLARVYLGQSRSSFRWAFLAQLALVGAGLILDPRLAAVLGCVPAWLLVKNAEQISELRF